MVTDLTAFAVTAPVSLLSQGDLAKALTSGTGGGLAIPVHGNWCGPNHPKGLGKPPLDGVDAACMHHDKCYLERGYFDCSCDQALVQDIRHDPTAIAQALVRYFRGSACRGGCKSFGDGLNYSKVCGTGLLTPQMWLVSVASGPASQFWGQSCKDDRRSMQKLTRIWPNAFSVDESMHMRAAVDEKRRLADLRNLGAK